MWTSQKHSIRYRNKGDRLGTVSASNKAIAKEVAGVFGGEWDADRYYNDDKTLNVDIVFCKDRPIEGVTSYSTVGISDTPLIFEGKEFHARAEIVGACESVFKKFPNVLASTAFKIINERIFIAPGVIIPGVFGDYKKRSSLKNLLLESLSQ